MNAPFSKGILAIDKPGGITSFDVIRQLRKITGIRRIGHTGTLDPFASGLLICLLGSYTRLASIGEAEDKSYLATLKLGQSSSTGDPEGEICNAAAAPTAIPNPQALINAALELKELPVPSFSAIKINGKRAYEYARKNQDVEMPIRNTKISSFEFIPWENGTLLNDAKELRYKCTVSKGTYIRSLSQWLALQLGTVGYTTSLRRLSIGSTLLESAIDLASLNSENWQSKLLPVQSILAKLPGYLADESQALLVKNGNPINLESPFNEPHEAVAIYSSTHELLALARCQNSILKPYLVIP